MTETNISRRLPWQKRYEATMIINHNPSRLPYWPIVATPEIGCFGRLRWINSDPSEQVWGRVWWSNRYGGQESRELYLSGNLIDELIKKGTRDILISKAEELALALLKVLQIANGKEIK